MKAVAIVLFHTRGVNAPGRFEWPWCGPTETRTCEAQSRPISRCRQIAKKAIFGGWPPSAAEGVDSACRPSVATVVRWRSVAHTVANVVLLFSLRRLCAAPDSHQRQHHFGKGKVEARAEASVTKRPWNN